MAGIIFLNPQRESVELARSIEGRAFFFTFDRMKWKIPEPKDGDKRTVKRFAWIPQEITDDAGKRYVVWLEFYYIEQVYCEGQEYKTRQWAEVEKKIKKG